MSYCIVNISIVHVNLLVTFHLLFCRKEVKLTDTLQEVILRAREDNRIASGVFDCASKLEQEPEMIMLCLLPGDSSGDITVSIQHKLIEAYCWENDIIVIKVFYFFFSIYLHNLQEFLETVQITVFTLS